MNGSAIGKINNFFKTSNSKAYFNAMDENASNYILITDKSGSKYYINCASREIQGMKEEFKVLEEALLNSIPSLQTVFLHGWVLRLNQKYTYRANCVCPLIYTEGSHAVEKVRMCEK